MSRSLRTLLPSAGLGLVGLLAPSSASALTCDEIMNMVNVNVPTNIVVQTIKDSGEVFAAGDIACLTKAGAPAEVLAQASSMTAAAEPADSAPRREITREEEEPVDDIIGAGRKSTKKLTDELPEEGESGVPDPEQIKEAIKLIKAKKPLTASLMLYQMLEDGRFPDQEVKINYYLARSFQDLEMYHSAQSHYMVVVKAGPSNPYFNYALPNLVKIARYTGDDTELMRIAPKISPEAYPRGAQNQLYYLMGVRRYKDEELSDARKYFGQVSTKSDLYLKSAYFEGVIYNQQGKLKSAVRKFRDVYREDVEVFNDPRELKEVQEIKDLSLMNVARIYYGIERFDESSKYYDLVSRDSDYWAEALFENAWAKFMVNDLNTSLGNVLTVQSPFFVDDEWLPEAIVLRALTFFNLCEYDEVEKILLKFESTHRPMQQEMRDFVKSYATAEGRALADQAWDTYFGRSARKDSALPKALFNRMLRNNDLAGVVRHLEIMDEEEALIDQQKSQWGDSVGIYLKKQLEEDRQRLKRKAGLLLLSEMARQANYVSDLITQSEIIRFEVVDAQRVDYQYRMSNPNLDDQTSGLNLDFATSVDFIYWPFNGEFWQDELGYYHYTEQGSCK